MLRKFSRGVVLQRSSFFMNGTARGDVFSAPGKVAVLVVDEVADLGALATAAVSRCE